MNRRNFLSVSGTASTGLLLASLDGFSFPYRSPEKTSADFELTIMATDWGFRGSMDQFCAAAKKEGYDGIEVWWPKEKKDQDELFEALSRHGLQVGFLCGGYDTDFRKHLDGFRVDLDHATASWHQKPLYINCHSGKDHFTFEQNQAFIDATDAANRKTGILVCHETHRGRMLFAAHVTQQYLSKNPTMKVNLDISHWCNVHESMLEDQQEAVALALDRAEHIHARIGHPEGPQVNDPRSPEWNEVVAKHLGWWDVIINRKKKSGGRQTILTEFGPPYYMPTVPYTRQALADQWGINVHMMNMLRKRYG